MPSKYQQYTLETKLRVLEAARRRGESWESIAIRCHMKHGKPTAEGRGDRTTLKITDDLVEILLNKLSQDPDLTLTQLVDKLEYATGVHVVPQTIKNHVDASCLTLRQLQREPQYMNKPVNKEKRRDYFIKLQGYQVAGKVILYMNKMNFNLLRGCGAIKKRLLGAVRTCASSLALENTDSYITRPFSAPTSSLTLVSLFATFCTTNAQPDRERIQCIQVERRERAGHTYKPEVATAAACREFYRHTLRFHAKVMGLEKTCLLTPEMCFSPAVSCI
ncbi:hypothetical protein PHPALM_37295 [Phytophthora palmivora]|uniref:Transposase n=1 Tax=Phytophthora palmivora TaxID=4796 RepID=A0A2P4WXS2_9STRA|nr:hypothetical protein PHPALM_37295 [Phytophthora palmivora]